MNLNKLEHITGEVETYYLEKNKNWLAPEIGINGIVLHSNCMGITSAVERFNQLNNKEATATFHRIIDKNQVLQTLPAEKPKRAKKGIHMNGKWDNSRLGIEMCEPQGFKYIGKTFDIEIIEGLEEAFKAELKQIIDKTVDEVTTLCLFHLISPDNIYTHSQGYAAKQGIRSDGPEHLWKHIDYDISIFKDEVKARMGQLKAEMPAAVPLTPIETKKETKAETKEETKVETKEEAPVEIKEEIKIEVKEEAPVEIKEEATENKSSTTLKIAKKD